MKRHKVITASILLAGCAGAAAIYVTAEPPSDNPFDEFENSKRFSHSVEVMGGKMSLVAHDMSKWFSSMWMGQQLAFTVVIITVVFATIYFLIASSIENDKNAS